MNTPPVPTEEEAVAARRFMLLGVMRIVTLMTVLLGLAIARSVIDGPYWLGVALALIGMITFFFGPSILAKRWKAGDRAGDGE